MSKQLKCLFCEFSGPLEDLRTHSATCAWHPAVRSAEKAEGVLESLENWRDPIGGTFDLLNPEVEVGQRLIAPLWAARADLDAANALVGELRKALGIYADLLNWIEVDGYLAWYCRHGKPNGADIAVAALTRTPTEALEALKERLRREGAAAELEALAAKIDRESEAEEADFFKGLLTVDDLRERSAELQLKHPDAPERTEEGR